MMQNSYSKNMTVTGRIKHLAPLHEDCTVLQCLCSSTVMFVMLHSPDNIGFLMHIASPACHGCLAVTVTVTNMPFA